MADLEKATGKRPLFIKNVISMTMMFTFIIYTIILYNMNGTFPSGALVLFLICFYGQRLATSYYQNKLADKKGLKRPYKGINEYL